MEFKWLEKQKEIYKERNKRQFSEKNEETIYIIEKIEKLIKDGCKYRYLLNFLEEVEKGEKWI